MRALSGRAHWRSHVKRKPQRQQSKGALELIEEATHLLRLLPLRYFVSYYSGALPFILGFLYFWADMSRNAFAHEHVVEGAFIVSLLFLWMKCWHVVFTNELRGYIAHEPHGELTLRRILRVIIIQATIQPSGLFILPITMVAVLPFGWAYAFYQNATAFGNGETGSIRTVLKKSWHHAKLFPRQNHYMLSIIFLFSFFMFLNIASLILIFPQLFKVFLGIETVLTRAGIFLLLNTTFLMVTCSIVYVLLDPLVKAIYVLRCFYGESLSTGEDLKIELRSFQPGRNLIALSLIAFLFIAGGITAETSHASDLSHANQMNSSAISSEEVDKSIRSILDKPEYSWKMPRQKPAETEEQGIITSFLNKVFNIISEGIKAVIDWLAKIFEWIGAKLDKLFKVEKKHTSISREWTDVLLYIFLMMFISGLIVILWKVWKAKKGRKAEEIVIAESRIPDITDEHITADELPTKKWLELASAFMEEGNMRFALRVLYFASLSHLSHYELITIALFKSNRDYERELQKKAHSESDLVGAFSQNIMIFERIWYGMHEVTGEIVESFKSNQERIMSFEKTF
jgi:NADH:ubiquinone oxidoreductase subunit 6 (subunit J)